MRLGPFSTEKLICFVATSSSFFFHSADLHGWVAPGQKCLSQRRLFDVFWEVSVIFVSGGLQAVDMTVLATPLESHSYASGLLSCLGSSAKTFSSHRSRLESFRNVAELMNVMSGRA